MYVLDATPLITLAHADRLAVLNGIDDPCRVPERVYHEVVTDGIEAGYPDARRIERAVDDDRLAVEAVAETDQFDGLRSAPTLSAADAAVLCLADQHDATAVMDEQAGRAVADAAGIRTRGTAYLVCSLVRDGKRDSEAAVAIIDDMIDAGWHCSTGLYRQILYRIDELGD